MVRRSKFIKFSSLRETTMIARDCQQMHYHHCGLWAVESSSFESPSSSLCMLTVCYYHVSVLPLNRYFGRMATTMGSWEHLLMCQRCAVCMLQKIILHSFSKKINWESTIVWLNLKHCESMLFHTTGNQLTRYCNYQKKLSACVTKMKSACMHQNEN